MGLAVLKQIPLEVWLKNELANPLPLCQLSLTTDEIEKRLAIKFEKIYEDGFGECDYAFIEWNRVQLILIGFHCKKNNERGILVQMHSHENHQDEIINYLKSELNLTQNEFTWMGEFIGEPQFALIYKDKDGAEIEVKRFHLESFACWTAKEYALKSDNRSYFVKQLMK